MCDEKYEIKRILAERKVDGKQEKMEYLVDWEWVEIYYLLSKFDNTCFNHI